jgi:hypothetical protein
MATNCKRILLEEFFDTASTEGNSSIEQHGATFYRGDNKSIHMHVGVRNIKQLKQILFALMFFSDSREKLESKLRMIGLHTKLEFKMRNVLKAFKQCVLELDTLASDQKKVRRQAKELKRDVIHGRAGSGKAYIGVHTMLERLASSNKINHGLISFCFNTESLGNETVKWICTRFGNSISISKQLCYEHPLWKKMKNLKISSTSGKREKRYLFLLGLDACHTK